jgi:lactonase family protein with 7-bladed beta-propeller
MNGQPSEVERLLSMKALAVWVFGYLVVGLITSLSDVPSFVNFETAPVHPIALSPDGRTLAVCNLPDGRVELFDVSSGIPVPSGDVPVGIDPVSCRFRTSNELWVVNFISSSVNVVDATRKHVVATLGTVAGPADVVFAGTPERAFVSCARSNTVMVFDPVTRVGLTNIIIDGDRPRAMAVSPDRSKVYVGIFESGNASTILVGDALKHPAGPYGGQYAVPYFGTNLPSWFFENVSACSAFEDQRPDSLIVKKNTAGRWVDDNNGDWTEFISGTTSGSISTAYQQKTRRPVWVVNLR